MTYTIVLYYVPLKVCNQNTPPDFLLCQKMILSPPRYKYDQNQRIQHILITMLITIGLKVYAN